MQSLNAIAERHGKRIDNWMRLASVKKMIDSRPDEVITKKGGQSGGTFASEYIALEFERWCQKDPLTASTYVYLIRALQTESFKIGISVDPRKRIRQMQTGSPVKLVLSRCVSVDNPKQVESMLHDVFKKYRIHGEWFSLEKEKALEIFDLTVASLD